MCWQPLLCVQNAPQCVLKSILVYTSELFTMKSLPLYTQPCVLCLEQCYIYDVFQSCWSTGVASCLTRSCVSKYFWSTARNISIDCSTILSFVNEFRLFTMYLCVCLLRTRPPLTFKPRTSPLCVPTLYKTCSRPERVWSGPPCSVPRDKGSKHNVLWGKEFIVACREKSGSLDKALLPVNSLGFWFESFLCYCQATEKA